MDSTDLEIQMSGFIIIGKYLLGATLHWILCWECSKGVNQTLVEHYNLVGEVYK